MDFRNDHESIDESARRRFESAWVEGHGRNIEEFLPPPEDPRRLATLCELVLIEIEFAWKAFGKSGDPTRTPPRLVEDYLLTYPELNTEKLCNRLVREEYLARHVNGLGPTAEEFRDRFPALSTVLPELNTVDGRDLAKQPVRRTPGIEGYEIVGVLGSGGMGVVYEAREAKLGRSVALKTSHGGSEKGREARRARFLAEARVSARLEHPGVVPVHELVTPEVGEPFYTMKLVRGRTLSDAIRDVHAVRRGGEWAVGQRRLLESFLAVTRTMAFAHEKGVIHRDLKPANIVLGEYGEAVILDWGIAKILHEEDSDDTCPDATIASSELTAHGEVLGTPAYMAPEQAGGRIGEIDGQSDVYALGAILYHILTGTSPVDGASTNLLRFVQFEEPKRPSAVAPWVSRPLEAVCLKAMAKSKGDRYPSAKILADDLERYLAGEPVRVYRERPGERFSRWSRRHRTLVAAGVVALILSAAGGTAGLYFRASAAQKLAFETERRQAKEREVVRNAALNEEARGLAELKAGRYADARQSFQKGLASLPAGDEPEIRATLEDRHRGAERLASFSRYRERTDRLALVTDDLGWTARDDAVLAACETGLRSLGVLGGSADWWNRLPDRELPDALRRRLREDTTSSLGLLALWRTKRGLVRQIKGQADGANVDFRSALDLIGRVQGFVRADPGRPPSAAAHGSPAASVVELFCRMRLDQKPFPARLTLVAETAPDLYFLGITHLFLSFAEPNSLEGRLFSSLLPFGDFLRRSGLDFETPLVAAERMLREAVALDPGYHMAHYWLGRCLMQGSNYSAAEQSFNACIALRPLYVPAYVDRCQALLGEAYTVKNPRPPRTPAELRTAALRGLEKAPDVIRSDPEVRFLEAICLSWLNREGEAVFAAADAVEKEIVQQYGVAPGMPSVSPQVMNFLKPRLKLQPDHPDLRATRALAAYAGRDEATARTEIEGILARGPHPRALTLRGLIRLREGAPADALADFDAACKDSTTSTKSDLAHCGRVWALERLGDWDAALQAYTRLLPDGSDGTGPQHLQPYLGQARCLERLGRSAEARRAVELAREIDPVAGDDLANRLFPSAVPE